MTHKQFTGLKIALDHLHPHPDNPRKNLGDITELTESIRKNGIMQNLTVIPLKEDDDPNKWEYRILIGHRRAAAAKEAGLLTVPCNVVFDMDPREQVAIMLEENMQRSDLTVIEQAQGFQMMLDLGETEESIAEKTGFSRTTVRHRLQIAKLDPKAIKKHENEEHEFQLSITDLIALERIKDMKVRNEILMNARDGRDLIQKVDIEVERAGRREIFELYRQELEAKGITEAPQKVVDQKYSNKYEQIGYFPLDKKTQIRLPKLRKSEHAWYMPLGLWDRALIVYQSRPKEEQAKSAHQIEQEKKEKNRKQLMEIQNAFRKDRKTFVIGILDGKYKCDDESLAWKVLTEAAIKLAARMYEENIGEYLTGKRAYNQTEEQKAEVEKRLAEMTSLEKLIVLDAYAGQDARDMISYDGKFYPESGEAQTAFCDALALWGYTVQEEEYIKLLDGTHELYAQKQEG